MGTVLALAAVSVSFIIGSMSSGGVHYTPIHESHWVKDCTPKDNDEYIPNIGIENSTHSFDLRNCIWSERK